jgi:hypothetical protein
MSVTHFEHHDLSDDLPEPGLYACSIISAKLSKSASGNRMIQVVYQLIGVPPGHERVVEYFALEGSSARGVAWARRRLVQLYRACGIEPGLGDPISPATLAGELLQVLLEHEDWKGATRLRVVDHRPPAAPSDDPAPF